MFKKFAITFLSVCIAAAMTLGVSTEYINDNIQNDISMCIMDAEEESF